MVLVSNRVVKDHVAIGRGDKLPFGLFPHQAWREFVITPQAVKLVVTELSRMLRKVRQGVIDLAAYQILTVI